ncbi:hypothetical protein JT06_03845 [Desulfobulbus sp. Tol-SR]|jgi:histidyl-tRNA synthetase|nr:hypothetical protein JT06_03845 [Desulfobulbus sp. Tol-SR]
MDISKKIYQDLGAKERAVASFAAISRGDHEEMYRLAENATKNQENKKAALALNQALNIYNHFMFEAIKDFLATTVKTSAAGAFCKGWLAAGGSHENLDYQKKKSTAEALTMLSGDMVSEIEMIRQAAKIWCKKNNIPLSLFSGPLCVQPLDKSDEIDNEIKPQDNSETSKIIMSIFDNIELPR